MTDSESGRYMWRRSRNYSLPWLACDQITIYNTSKVYFTFLVETELNVMKALSGSWQHVGKLPTMSHHKQLLLGYLETVSIRTNGPCEWWKQIKNTHDEAKDHSGEETADEALPGLLWGELQWSWTRNTDCLSRQHDISLNMWFIFFFKPQLLVTE